ncbi:MAG: 50S ribosomal protein L18 [Chlorobi bacterium OLB5]|nr:MAG: 50S ribosomal protein L18 [Chlorobi bacterium OLB5]
MPTKTRLEPRQKIKLRIRKRIIGTPDVPRFVIFRSLNNIYAQLIDDINGKTLCSVSSIAKDVKSEAGKISKTEKSKVIGKKIAEKASEKNIIKVVFDRNGYLYHGRVKAIADAAREAGLKF